MHNEANINSIQKQYSTNNTAQTIQTRITKKLTPPEFRMYALPR